MINPVERGPHPLVIGHRGAAGYAPENTMSSFRKGKQLGADWLECDVHLSADGHLIVIHDETVDRTTDGTGAVRDLRIEGLRALRVADRDRVPTLDELLEWVGNFQSLGLVIEIKNGPYFYAGIEDAVQKAIERHGMEGRSMVVSFDHVCLRALRRLGPKLRTGILYYGRLADPVAAANAVGADAIWPGLALLDEDTVGLAHGAGLGAFTWTANTTEAFARALASGVDGIVTDFPDRLVDTFRR